MCVASGCVVRNPKKGGGMIERSARIHADRLLSLALVAGLLVTLPRAGWGETKSASTAATAAPASPSVLKSWNDGAARRAIVDFVARVTRDGPDFVPVSERIAVFDNDGTLWSEKPVPFQVTFALDRVQAMAPLHPD